jgi:mycothiol synthase
VTTLRPVNVVDDLEALWQVAVECELDVIPEVTTTHEEVRSTLSGPGVDLETGVRVAVDDGGRIQGYITTELDPEGREILIDAYSRPGVDGSVLEELLAHGLSYARGEVAKLDDAKGWVCAAGAFVGDDTYAKALTNAGFTPVRRFHRMRIDFTQTPRQDVPPLPDGTSIAVVTEDEQRIVHDVLEDAFVGHWRHVRRSFDDWIAFFRNRGYDPSQWWLATVDGAPAAALVGNESFAEVGSSYVGMLGVLPQFRGRGLGRALLLTAFAEAARRGRTSVRLGVDTENGTGAPALYAGVGMTPVETIEAYEQPLD